VRSGVRLANLFLEIEFQALTSELSENPFQHLVEELRCSVGVKRPLKAKWIAYEHR
jgi:hypothetical protein